MRCCSPCCSIPRPSVIKVPEPLTTNPDNPPLADDAALVPAKLYILKRIAKHRARWHLRQAAAEQARADALKRVIQEDVAEAQNRLATPEVLDGGKAYPRVSLWQAMVSEGVAILAGTLEVIAWVRPLRILKR